MSILLTDQKLKKLEQQHSDKKVKRCLLRILIRTPIIYRKITKQNGFNAGLVIEKWLSSNLADNEINNVLDLEYRIKQLPLLFMCKKPVDKDPAELAIITSEITTNIWC